MNESSLIDINPFGSEEQSSLDRSFGKDTSDNALMRAIVLENQIALDELYCRYRLLLRKIIAQIVPNEADVDETLQDIFLEIWNKAIQFDSTKGEPLGWIICIARRRAIDRTRRTRLYATHTVRLDAASSEYGNDDLHPSGIPAAYHDQPKTQDLLVHLLRIVAILPPEQRQVVQLTYFEGLSQRTIAARTGTPLGTVKTRLELAKRKLLVNSAHLRQEI